MHVASILLLACTSPAARAFPLGPCPGDCEADAIEAEAGPTDERVREAWSYLLPGEQVDAVARFEAHVVWMESFQNSLIKYALAQLEEDPGLFPESEDPPYFDPQLHAPGQPIERKRVDPEGSRARRVVERLTGTYPRRMQPAWRYDWAERQIVRTADFQDPQRLFDNALAGLPPRVDLAEALVLALLDDGVMQDTHRAFAHAYTDRMGRAYPVTLYAAWCSGESLEMPDVDTLGIVHTLDDEWQRWTAPVSPAKLDDLYELIGSHFEDARRHRGLRVALARTFLVGSADMRDGYDSHLTALHAFWDQHASTPDALATELPDGDEWAAFLEGLVEQVADDEDLAAAGLYRLQLLDWEGWRVRDLMIAVLRDTGAFERKRRPPAPSRTKRKQTR